MRLPASHIKLVRPDVRRSGAAQEASACAPEATSSMHDDASLRAGRMAAAVLIFAVLVMLCVGGYALAELVGPGPVGVPCGRVVKLSSGYEAYVECADDDAPRSEER